MVIFEWLDKVDKAVFTAIQLHATADWLDQIMLLLRNAATWIPLYLFMGIWIWKNHPRRAFTFILLTVVGFALCDFTSASIFKPLFARLRPCYDADTQVFVRGVITCGGRFSFPSSHAANHFGLAAFWYNAIRQLTGQRWRWLWYWAGLICFAQVYVGKHFPLDVAAGALLGTAIGILTAGLFRRWQPRWYSMKRHNPVVQTS